MDNLPTKKEDKNFVDFVNDNLQIDKHRGVIEMEDSAFVAHKCIRKLEKFIDAELIPASINPANGEVLFMPLNPQSIKQIADANNVAMSTIRKIRGLDKQNDEQASNNSLDHVLKAAYNKLQAINVTQNNITIQDPRIINPKAIDPE